MSVPPSNPYGHDPSKNENEPDGSDAPSSGASPYGPATPNPYGAPSPYQGGYEQPPTPQSPYGTQPPYGGQAPHSGQQPFGAQPPYAGQPFNQQPYASGPYTGGPYAGGGMGWGGNTSKNQLGGWALGLGIAGVVCCGPAGIAAIVLGVQSRAAADQGLATNKGMGTAGMALGITAVALWAILFTFGMISDY